MGQLMQIIAGAGALSSVTGSDLISEQFMAALAAEENRHAMVQAGHDAQIKAAQQIHG
jgi:hypothetical protein